MCDGVHFGEFEGLVSVERWPCCRGALLWEVECLSDSQCSVLSRDTVCLVVTHCQQMAPVAHP